MRALWLGCFYLFAATASAFADPPALPVITATPAMWTVHGSRGTAYLLGSIHILPEGIDWKTPQLMAAFKSANTFVFEIPMASSDLRMAGRVLAQNELLPLSNSLPSYFDSEMRAEWRSAVANTHVHAEALVGLRPWAAARELRDAMSGDVPMYAADGVDNMIDAMAEKRGITDFRAFETADFQVHVLMGGATPDNEMSQLRDAMREASTRKIMPFDKLLLAWETGDVRTIAAVNDTESPEEHKAMLDDRNKAWVPQIEKMLKEKRTFFVTVGAAHLAGPNGVPSLLRAAGYKVDGP
jgi:uncharacterized protein YbaP (TraB family)